MYVTDETAVRETIATNNARIEKEHAFTIERVERLRRFARTDEEMLDREREEWRRFHAIIRPMEQENEVLIKALANLKSFESPAPIIISR